MQLELSRLTMLSVLSLMSGGGTLSVVTVETESEVHGLDRRARRRQETRQSLIAAGLRLISVGSVEALRIRDLTTEADVGHGSFYNHFQSKEEFVAAVVEETWGQLADTVLRHVPHDTDLAVQASEADRRFLRLAIDEPDFARLLVNLNNREDVFGRAVYPFARATLAPGMATGRFDVSDFDAVLLTLTGSAMAMIRAILEGNAPSNPDSAHAELVLRMLGVPASEAVEISRRPLTTKSSTEGRSPTRFEGR